MLQLHVSSVKKSKDKEPAGAVPDGFEHCLPCLTFCSALICLSLVSHKIRSINLYQTETILYARIRYRSHLFAMTMYEFIRDGSGLFGDPPENKMNNYSPTLLYITD